MPNLNRMTEDHKAVYDCLANPTLADVLNMLIQRRGGVVATAKFLGVSLEKCDHEQVLLNAVERRLSSLVDEALVTRSNGNRETAIYKAA